MRRCREHLFEALVKVLHQQTEKGADRWVHISTALWSVEVAVSPVKSFEEFGPSLAPATMLSIKLQRHQAIVKRH
jgi:hypothetical protein